MSDKRISVILEAQIEGFKASLAQAQDAMSSSTKGMGKAWQTFSNNTNNQGGKVKGVFNKIADSGDNLRNRQTSLFGTLFKGAAAWAGITSGANLFNSAIGRVDNIRSNERAMTDLLGSQEKATEVMEGLQRVVDGTPLSLDSFTASAKGMIAAGMEAEKVEGVMLAIGSAAYGVGEGAESIDPLSQAFKSLQASGVASLGDLNRLLNQNIPVYQILGNQLGMTTEEVKKYISDGLLPSGEAIDLITDGIMEGTDGVNGSTSAMAGQMDNAADTIKGALANIKTAVVKSLAKPFDNAYEKIVDALKGIKNSINDVQPVIESVFMTIGEIIEGVVLGVIDTFKMLQPAIETVVDWVKKLAEKFSEADSEGSGFKEMARELTPVILAVVGAFKAMQGVAVTVSILRDIKKAFNGISTAMEATKSSGGVFKLLKKGATLVSGAFSTLSGVLASLVANPVALAIAAGVLMIAGLIYLWKTNEDFRNAIIDIWNKVKEAFSNAAEAIKGFMGNMKDKIVEVWEGIKNVFSTTIEFISNIVQVGFMAIHAIIEGVMMFISAIIETAWNVIKAVIDVTMQIIKGIIEVIWSFIGDKVMAVMEGIKEVVTTIWNAVKDFITAVLEAIKEIVINIWDAIKETISTVLGAIKEVVSNIWNSIKEVISTVMGAIKEVVTTIWNAIKGIISTVMTAIMGVITNIWNSIKAVISSVLNAIKEIVSSIWNGIKSTTSSIWNGIKETISSIVNGIRNVVSNVFNAIKGIATSVWNGVKTAMTTPIEAAKNTISGILDRIKSLFNNLKLRFPSISIPHVPMPRFSISGGFSINPPRVPRFNVSWHESGGLFDGSRDGRIVGLAENHGSEAIIPLSKRSKMAPFASAIASMMPERESGGGSGEGDTNVTVNVATLVVREEADVKKISQGLAEEAKRAKNRRGK